MLTSSFKEWILQHPSSISIISEEDGPPPAVLFRVLPGSASRALRLVAENWRDGRAQVFISAESEEEDEALDEWLANINNTLADRLLPMGEILDLLSPSPRREEPLVALCQRWQIPRDFGERLLESVVPSTTEVDAALRDSSLSDEVQFEPSLGLVQLRWTQQGSSCMQLGLELEMPVLLSLAFPLDTLGKEVSLSSAHLVRFDQADINRLAPPCFATRELLPRLLKDLSFRQGNLSQLLEVIWKAVADFLLTPEGRCPVCLATHQTTGLWRCSPCSSELCRFQFEETCSLIGLLKEDASVVALHLALASVAAEAGVLEPFPPQLLSSTGTSRPGRGRVGTAARASTAAASAKTRGLFDWLFHTEQQPCDEVPATATDGSISAMLAQMPSAEKLCQASEEELKHLLDHAGPNTYPVLRFLLASCPLALHPLKRSEQLSMVTGPGVQQLAVLQAAPAQEAVFRQWREDFGSSFGIHGSPLQNWYSIIRNGLQILSNTELMRSGARFGTGLYLADKVTTAQHYCGGFAGSRYAANVGEALQILAVVEYINDPSVHQRHSEGITTVTDPAAVMLRFLLVYSLSSQISADKLDALEVKQRWNLLTEQLAKNTRRACGTFNPKT